MEEAKYFKCGSVVHCLSNRSALVRVLLSYNLLFVSHLLEDKSLALRTRVLSSFSTDIETVLELSIS